MKRPLRSVMIGDVDLYPSEFIFGVGQGMTLLGHWHATINIRQPLSVIAKRLHEVQPDIIWGHMLLWAPGGDVTTLSLLALCQTWKDRGTLIVIHDGDARKDTRFPQDISSVVDLALCNHEVPRTEWGIPTERWPYFAFTQGAIAEPADDLMCDLAFAGRRGGAMYAKRDTLLNALHGRFKHGFREFPTEEHPHTLFRTPELAASASAVLGFGRPELPGWTDVRVFQYPGAGGVLLHDDAHEFLVPHDHFVPYTAGDVDSIVEAFLLSRLDGPAIRQRAFRYVQDHHSSVPRVKHVLTWLDLV